MNPLVRTALNFGAFSGLSTFIVFLIIYFLGYNPLGLSSWLGAWIPVLFIFLGIKSFRDNELDGAISFGKALITGLYITIAAAFLFDVLLYVFGTFIDAGLVEMQINEAIEGIEKYKKLIGEDKYEEVMSEIEKERNKVTIGNIAMNDFLAKVIGGFIVSLIAGAFLKKSKPFFDQGQDV